jgi:hypothetical protein
VPLTDIAPPREIPLEERLLRERKEKQTSNQLHNEHEKQLRLEREQLAKRNSMFSNQNDTNNKKVTYDHHGKVLFIKTIKSNR